MSALAVFFERCGIATVVVGLTHLHLEKVQPPRALWVPFELGRPLGDYVDNGAWQHRVLASALALLDRQDGPVVLEEFAEDDPGAATDPNWRAPIQAAASVIDEVGAIVPVWHTAVEKSGRSMTGLSGLQVHEAAHYLLAFADDQPLHNPDDAMSDLLRMRFCADDLKTAYLEAAMGSEQHPSSRQLGLWLWNDTQAGALLRRIREQNLEHEDDRRRTVCTRFLVPGAYL